MRIAGSLEPTGRLLSVSALVALGLTVLKTMRSTVFKFISVEVWVNPRMNPLCMQDSIVLRFRCDNLMRHQVIDHFLKTLVQ